MTGMPAADEIRRALADILGWEPLVRSPQLAGFLTYVVDKSLAGEESAIKAYSIAVDVFGRPPSFDPQSDPIVRVQARRLRALLDQYYAEAGEAADVRIILPVGRYVPTFEGGVPERGPFGAAPGRMEAPWSPLPERRRFSRRGAFVAGAAVAILVVLLIVMFGGGAV